MTEDRDGTVRLPPDQLAALERAMREGPMRVPPLAPSEVPSGIDAAVIRKAVSTIIDDELSRRRVLSDPEIREIAKDVARTIFEQSIRPYQDQVRNFLTEDEIEAIVVEKLKDIGIKADKHHADATRETMEGLQRGHRRRNEFGKDFAKEIVKALATLGIGGFLAFAGTYIAIKGGGH